MESVNEQSQSILTVNFRDEDYEPVTPSTFKYRIIDVASDTEIKATTTITPLSSSYDITMTANENRIIDATQPFEQRRVTVQWYSGATLIGTGDYVYKVLNLYMVPLT